MNSPIMFGEWLRQRRDGLGLTRKEFARRVGCSVSTLRKIENDERRPSGQIAELMANSLDIPSADHSTFVRVARGELNVDRILSPSTLIPRPNSSSPKTNLPVLPTPLIGRQREIDEISRLLRDPQCHLLTLVGPGGIGKTRLAIETASHVTELFADGVYFVPLAPVNSVQFIMPVIADSIGFAFESANRTDPKTQLFNYLQEKQVLLLMDNLEHLLIDPGVEVFAELLANAPRVKLLTTSRETLGLQGEWIFDVYGLPIPEDSQTEGFAQDTSIELFIQRARRAHVKFNAAPEDLPIILQICRLVDGTPLAIELAASWVRTLSCHEIAREIERGLDFLSTTTRDLPARHRSMRAVFDHSWKLLTEEEQKILLQLSIFRGGFQREAAEQVAGATLSALSALMTKSLLHRSGGNRFDLHELIRQYALERLADEPKAQKEAQARHAHYYMEYFSSRDAGLRSSAQHETIAELTVEMDNFRAAWDWAVNHGEFALIERSLRASTYLCEIRGRWQEGLDILGSAAIALETAHRQTLPDRVNQVALGRVLACSSLLTSRLGGNEKARAMLEHSLEILRPLNEPRVLVESVTFLGNIMEYTGNYAGAAELYSEGLEIATAIGDRWFAAYCATCLVDLTGITLMKVTFEDAHEQLQSVVADWRAIGDPRFIAAGLNTLSWSALRLGRYDEARTALEESILLNGSVEDRWGLGFSYRGLALISQAQGDHPLAVEMFRKSLDTLTQLGARQSAARVLAEMSRSIFALGDEAEAERGWREATRVALETKGKYIILEALVGVASLKTKRGEVEKALELLLIVLNHPASLQETKDRAAHRRAELEAQLTQQQIESIQTRAQAQTFDAVVEDILK